MIALDTNILVYAHRGELPRHEAALGRLRALAEGPSAWALPVFCLGEFVRVTTHPRVFAPPTPLAEAVGLIEALLGSPTCRLLQPGERFWPILAAQLKDADARGNLAFDAQIAALCVEHGATLLTADRDFARFPGLRTEMLPIG